VLTRTYRSSVSALHVAAAELDELTCNTVTETAFAEGCCRLTHKLEVNKSHMMGPAYMGVHGCVHVMPDCPMLFCLKYPAPSDPKKRYRLLLPKCNCRDKKC
jgi:hypothetical protein